MFDLPKHYAPQAAVSTAVFEWLGVCPIYKLTFFSATAIVERYRLFASFNSVISSPSPPSETN